MYGTYFNLVAVYAEGKSEFLKGWTRVIGDNIKQNSLNVEKFQNTPVVKKLSGGYLISPPSSSPSNLIKSLSIYNAIGKKISMISSINKNQVFWKTSNRNIPEGLYIARLELLDKTSCSRAFILSSRENYYLKASFATSSSKRTVSARKTRLRRSAARGCPLTYQPICFFNSASARFSPWTAQKSMIVRARLTGAAR